MVHGPFVFLAGTKTEKIMIVNIRKLRYDDILLSKSPCLKWMGQPSNMLIGGALFCHIADFISLWLPKPMPAICSTAVPIWCTISQA